MWGTWTIYTTIARRLVFLGTQGCLEMEQGLSQFAPLPEVQFDDLETFEHAKSKPLSVTLAVSRQRKILGFEVSSMPAKGPLAEIGRKRYGFRPDGRSQALRNLLNRIRPRVAERAIVWSDENPRYPKPVARIFPHARHETVKGRRGCVTGQGELKRGGFDPLYSLNHTCAMLRANVNRLVRKTWCTTKKAENLAHHLAIYANYHNSVLIRDGENDFLSPRPCEGERCLAPGDRGKSPNEGEHARRVLLASETDPGLKDFFYPQ